MKVNEIVATDNIVKNIIRSPNKKGDRKKMLRKYLKKKSRQNNPGPSYQGALPVNGGNFSGLF